MKKFCFFLFIIFQISLANAQYLVKGVVQDSSGLPLTGAIVRLKFQADSIAAIADTDGSYVFRNVKSNQFTLSASFISFRSFIKAYNFSPDVKEIIIPAIKLGEASNNLNAVVITAVTPVKIKEDTLEFNAQSFAVREGSSVDAVLKKLPGVAVDKNGNVTTQGKPITKVRVNGKDFFGADVATAIQNLPADIVKNLQVIDDYGDQAKLTGIKTGESEKILNINIDEDKKRGYFARGTGGMGNQERYLASMRANFFRGEQQISVNGTMNNTNLRGGGGDGTTDSKHIGANYRNKFNEKVSVDGGYSFRNRDNNTFGSEYTQNFGFGRFEDRLSDNSSRSNGHNFWGNFEYTLDTLNYIKISPYGSFNNSANTNSGTSFINQTNIKEITERSSRSFSNSLSGNVGTNIFLNHKFLKKGRNISLFATLNYNAGDGARDVQNDYIITDSVGRDSTRNQYQLIDNSNKNIRTSSNLSYIEPIGKQSFVELSYNWSRSNAKTNRYTEDVENDLAIPNPNLSNDFEYQFTTNRLSLNYRYLHQKYNYTLGFGAQQAQLEGQNINKGLRTDNKTVNLVPTARFVYRFNKQKSLSVNYNGRNNQPGFNQLQPLTDNSNLQNTVTGNPDLKPEFVHGLNMEYNQSDWKSGHTLYTNLEFSKTQNKIVTTKVQVNNTSNQLTGYTNTDGFYSLRGNYAYSKPFSERKYTITFDGGASFNNNIAFIGREGVMSRNIAQNLVINQGLEFGIDLKDIVDLEFRTSYSVNSTRFSQESSTDRKTNTVEFQLEGENYFFKDLTLGYEVSKRINSGFSNSAIKNPTIANVFIEYRFLKGNAGTFRIQGFDLLNQNTGFVRDVYDNIIVDRQTNRLGRYFLMSFGLRLRKFGV